MLRHFARRRTTFFSASTFGVIALATACSAGKGGVGNDDSATGGSAEGGTSSGGVSGVPIGGASGAAGVPVGGGGTGGGPDCAGDLIMGQPVPVDVYIMLDISGSMLTNTGAGTSKWDAVKRAIGAFVNNEDSAGLGVAIQYFPLQAPGVPASCTTHEQCMSGGPCLLKACEAYDLDRDTNLDGFVQCNDDTGCQDALVKDDGPCEMGACRLSGAPCTDAASCQAHASMIGSCADVGVCQSDMTTACIRPGTLCGPMNPCVAASGSICVHEMLCDQASYETPAVEFAALPGAAPAIVASLGLQAPRGETPSRPALRGAIDHARDWATAHPGHSVVVVLATDGLPTDCSNGNARHPSSPAEVDEVVAVATEGLSTSPNVSTFVVGVFAASDTTAPANLDRIALAGGTEHAFMVDASSSAVNTQFAEALNAVRTSRLGCEFQIPTPPAGQTLDYKYVNVVLNDAAGNPTEIPRVLGGIERCAEVGGGWYYDPDLTDTSTTPPTRIVACPSTCGTLTSTVGGSVQIKLGCRTTEK